MSVFVAITEQPFVAIQVTATFLNFGVLFAAAWMIRSHGSQFKGMLDSQAKRLDAHERKLEILDRDSVTKEDWLRVSNRTDHKVDRISEQMAAVRQALTDGGHRLDAN